MGTAYAALLSTKRLNTSKIKRSSKLDEFYSDRSRIIYCSSFRRLQQKAQVFSLESNSNVRTRMTHSLEVSDLGRTLSYKIARKLVSNNLLTEKEVSQLVAIVENTCLLHDIGNLPFGHFAESAIQTWAKSKLRGIANKKFHKKCYEEERSNLFKLLKDFEEFDGNPQGFRIITKLHTERDKFSLNLTYATMFAALKYVRSTDENGGTSITKKAGYFQTEKDIVERLKIEVNVKNGCRYPLTYIMEAADDIAYCLSDIADGIKKKIITKEQFLQEMEKEWEKNYNENFEIKMKELNLPIDNEYGDFNHDISIPWARVFMDAAINNYIDKHDEFLSGTADALIPDEFMKILNTIKNVSRKILYTSIEAESIELTGYAVISGILSYYERLIRLDCNDFDNILKDMRVQGKEVEIRLLHLIGDRYIKAYKYEIENYKKSKLFEIYEWWLRIHLILDHISGMTDEFALETYQMLKGIKLMRV